MKKSVITFISVLVVSMLMGIVVYANNEVIVIDGHEMIMSNGRLVPADSFIDFGEEYGANPFAGHFDMEQLRDILGVDFTIQ